MKKIYLFAFSLIAISQVKAQLTLTKAANEPVIGDSYITKTLDTNFTALPLNVVGTNVTWNIANVIETGATSTNTYSAPGSGASSYPGTTIVQEDQGTGNTSYFKATASSYELLGAELSIGGIGAQLNYNTNSAIIAQYPITMGYTNTDPVAGTVTASTLTGTFNGTIATTADGTGTLNFVGGGSNFTNVLRIKTTQHIAFSLPSGLFTINGTIDQSIYNYYHSSSKWPLFTATYNHVFSNNVIFPIDDTVNDVMALSTVIVGIKERTKAVNDIIFKAYPNPAHNQVAIHFVLTQKESYNIEIVNALGQVVKSVSKPDLQPGLYNEAIDINGLSAGVYHIRVQGKNASGVEKLIVE
jgi:hypothetical protein